MGSCWRTEDICEFTAHQMTSGNCRRYICSHSFECLGYFICYILDRCSRCICSRDGPVILDNGCKVAISSLSAIVTFYPGPVTTNHHHHFAPLVPLPLSFSFISLSIFLQLLLHYKLYNVHLSHYIHEQ